MESAVETAKAVGSDIRGTPTPMVGGEQGAATESSKAKCSQPVCEEARPARGELGTACPRDFPEGNFWAKSYGTVTAKAEEATQRWQKPDHRPFLQSRAPQARRGLLQGLDCMRLTLKRDWPSSFAAVGHAVLRLAGNIVPPPSLCPVTPLIGLAISRLSSLSSLLGEEAETQEEKNTVSPMAF
ncbi:uncharacterized protein LOC117283736 isoform X2 [Fukomys damarensis]|uniref:uncharacterized protein LOC117283736 isoform X2 n=1 Tax=Fukomys damarensis TaxID=885580 RepID=UPI001454FF38|nr:uncharacterized protein LOC117283736 isoform X2 [Fukomys damarensis]